MRIRTYGTRGSTPVARPEIRRYGGNTTCIRVMSNCLPTDTALLVDAGTGLVPASFDLQREGVRRILLLMTHYHHDHTQGFPLAPQTFDPSIPIDVYGPREHGIGPQQMLETIMRAPFFPVNFSRVSDHITCHDMDSIGSQVLLIHPVAGARLMEMDAYQRIADAGSLDLGATRISLKDCLIVRMHQTVHPEFTVSYRFEERSTDRVAVVLTDHENTQSLPMDLRKHLDRADLLIQDAQYTRAQYDKSSTGFGHGTGDYSARVMKECGVRHLGQTHHDPMANDPDVEVVVLEARTWLVDNGAPELAEHVFACADYQDIEV